MKIVRVLATPLICDRPDNTRHYLIFECFHWAIWHGRNVPKEGQAFECSMCDRPGHVHYQGRSAYYANPDAEPLPECGDSFAGEDVAGYAAPDRVTCARCKLTPAYLEATR